MNDSTVDRLERALYAPGSVDWELLNDALEEIKMWYYAYHREIELSDRLAGALAETHRDSMWMQGCLCKDNVDCEANKALAVYSDTRHPRPAF